MKKTFVKRIVSVIAIFSIFINFENGGGLLPLSITVNATDTTWKIYLKNFLVSSFPSLFDEATIKKNEEAFEKNYTTWKSKEDYPPDAIDESEWGMSPALPYDYTFYDLDNDNIPEAFILYGVEATECGWTQIYKLYGKTYEFIGYGSSEPFGYFAHDQQNRLVMVNDEYGIENMTINFAEIQDKQIIYSDYIDDKGKKFDPNSQGDDYYKNEAYINQILSQFTHLSEFDCSAVIDSIKNNTPLQIIDDNTEFVYDIYKKALVNKDNVDAASDVIGKIDSTFSIPDGLTDILQMHGISGLSELSENMKLFSGIINAKQILEFLLLYASIQQMQDYMNREREYYLNISQDIVNKIDVVIQNILILKTHTDLAVALFSSDYIIMQVLNSCEEVGWFTEAIATLGSIMLGGMPSQDSIDEVFGTSKKTGLYDFVSNQIKTHVYLT